MSQLRQIYRMSCLLMSPPVYEPLSNQNSCNFNNVELVGRSNSLDCIHAGDLLGHDFPTSFMSVSKDVGQTFDITNNNDSNCKITHPQSQVGSEGFTDSLEKKDTSSNHLIAANCKSKRISIELRRSARIALRQKLLAARRSLAFTSNASPNKFSRRSESDVLKQFANFNELRDKSTTQLSILDLVKVPEQSVSSSQVKNKPKPESSLQKASLDKKWISLQASIKSRWNWLDSQIIENRKKLDYYTRVQELVRLHRKGSKQAESFSESAADEQSGDDTSLSDSADCDGSAARCRPLPLHTRPAMIRLARITPSLRLGGQASRPCNCVGPDMRCIDCCDRAIGFMPRHVGQFTSTLAKPEPPASADPSFHPVLSFPHEESPMRSRIRSLQSKLSTRLDHCYSDANARSSTGLTKPVSAPHTATAFSRRGRPKRPVKKDAEDWTSKNRFKLKSTAPKAPRNHTTKATAAAALLANARRKKGRPPSSVVDQARQSRALSHSLDLLRSAPRLACERRAGSVSSGEASCDSTTRRRRSVAAAADDTFDIGNMVLPGFGGSRPIDPIRYKEIAVPRWRLLADDEIAADADGTPEQTEDISDAAFVQRFARCEELEKQRFRNMDAIARTASQTHFSAASTPYSRMQNPIISYLDERVTPRGGRRNRAASLAALGSSTKGAAPAPRRTGGKGSKLGKSGGPRSDTASVTSTGSARKRKPKATARYLDYATASPPPRQRVTPAKKRASVTDSPAKKGKMVSSQGASSLQASPHPLKVPVAQKVLPPTVNVADTRKLYFSPQPLPSKDQPRLTLLGLGIDDLNSSLNLDSAAFVEACARPPQKGLPGAATSTPADPTNTSYLSQESCVLPTGATTVHMKTIPAVQPIPHRSPQTPFAAMLHDRPRPSPPAALRTPVTLPAKRTLYTIGYPSGSVQRSQFTSGYEVVTSSQLQAILHATKQAESAGPMVQRTELRSVERPAQTTYVPVNGAANVFRRHHSDVNEIKITPVATIREGTSSSSYHQSSPAKDGIITEVFPRSIAHSYAQIGGSPAAAAGMLTSHEQRQPRLPFRRQSSLIALNQPRTPTLVPTPAHQRFVPVGARSTLSAAVKSAGALASPPHLVPSPPGSKHNDSASETTESVSSSRSDLDVGGALLDAVNPSPTLSDASFERKSIDSTSKPPRRAASSTSKRAGTAVTTPSTAAAKDGPSPTKRPRRSSRSSASSGPTEPRRLSEDNPAARTVRARLRSDDDRRCLRSTGGH